MWPGFISPELEPTAKIFDIELPQISVKAIGKDSTAVQIKPS